ncbi:hypothetical protein [Candidatus Nitrotoga sp. AM1P]|uniref:hypothetical protein n=1 Tax=Candidatus Nitrotoga sp. AM1P TaxID=2559597 RepID=UPI001565D9F9|nr:hypothetical protein [Candidatus Nitrotoga sp. AM1P]
MTGLISDDFSLKIKSSGYQWAATGAAPVNPTYVSGAVNEIFTAGDFKYEPQTAKPGRERWACGHYRSTWVRTSMIPRLRKI